ncbi:glycine/betaine ABC transporter substrate-binding protein [Paenibacillus selenitireducens]|uniref:Glycine/betaine ABC transporter substrate-binding protein n=1 Tax=Paenibacillus selenitireducens TaxID=1324314 RepID=A0A1T2X2L9_9BACL|nr:glycine betaine ABC transporter substrate-binding protein [Paenibacillus selenitireducens]OPA73966.1 glycine/betaine ABC transporter substrate-binding protein [Paenibacillus selenitireducens]
MKRSVSMVSLLLVLIIALVGCSSGKESKGTITIGSKNFTENILLAHMLADLIEKDTELAVERKVNLGGSDIAWKALKSNDIQLYPDYTGTIVANYYQQETGTAEETYNTTIELLSKDKLSFPSKFGFNNTYTLAVSKETAEKYHLKTFSDLTKISNELVLGCEFEFKDRPDGYPGLEKTYEMTFKKVNAMDRGIMYRSLTDKQVDVIDAYSTEGQIKVNDLVILEDDKGFFPPYHAGALIRDDVLAKYPELEAVLKKLEGALDEQTMQDLNAKVDSEGLKAETVAKDFLKEKGLI